MNWGKYSAYAIFGTIIFISLFSFQSALAEDSYNRPLYYTPTPSLSKSQMTFSIESQSVQTYDVLLIEDLSPWSSTANSDLLNTNEISFKKITISEINEENLNNYKKIIIAGDQNSDFYEEYMENVSIFNQYVENGGILEWHVCGFGWNSGDSSGIILPGGISMNGYAYISDYNYIKNNDHPLINGVQSTFWGSYASHGYFVDFIGIPNLVIITAEEQEHSNRPTLVEYSYGKGWVVASSQPLEYGYTHDQDSGIILANLIPYYSPKKTDFNVLSDESHVAFVKVSVDLAEGSMDNTIAVGHAWIEIFDLSSKEKETWGTWGNLEPIGLYTNKELYRSALASRSMFINQKKYDALHKLIESYSSKGEKAWGFKNNCTAFAKDSWKAVSDEKINVYFVEDFGFPRPTWPNPVSIMYWIIDENGGVSDRTINECNSPFCESTCPEPAIFCN